nr:putative transposase (putative), gypsy type [Tanacetum cinerariifolium]
MFGDFLLRKKDTVSLTARKESRDWTPSRVTVYREVARWRARIVLFEGPRSLCSTWPRAGYASLQIRGVCVSCDRVWIMFLAGRLAFGYFGSFQVLGLGQLLIVWYGLAARVKLYIIMSPQSSVSFVRAKDIARLRSAQLLAVSCLVCVPHTLLGARIVTTVHLSLFSPFDEGCGNVDSPEGKIDMYTRFIEFANFRIPLSKFLLYVLEYYQINLSQLSVIGASKVSHFEIMCRAFGRVPTVGTFRRLYVKSISNGWLSFLKRSDVNDPCYYSKKFNSLKNWNNNFFWIDTSVCPLSIPWFSGTFVVKDLLLVDEAVDLPCVELLNENRTIIRKYLKVFLCLVGLSGLFPESDVRPTLLRSDDEEMGLLDFVNSADPFKVKTGERTLAENEVPLLTETEDKVISPSPQTISLVDHTIQHELNAYHTGKSPTALQRLIKQSGQVDAGSGSVVPAAKDITSSSITPTPERAPEDDLRDNVGRVVTHVSSAPTDVSVPVIDPASDVRGSSAASLEAGTRSMI